MISSKVTFTLFAQAELTPEEHEYVEKYRMGKEVLYNKVKVDASGVGLPGMGNALIIQTIS